MFGTSGIRGPVGETVTADLALSVGRALGVEYGTVVVGQDPRESGQLLSAALTAGLRESGTDVLDCGLASTPTVARAVGREDAGAGVAITASHNPAPDNGLKLWQPSGQAFDDPMQTEVTERIRAGAFDPAAHDELGSHRAIDARERHVEDLARNARINEPLSVVVDVGNGAGGLTVDALDRLGCAVETLNAQPDGTFPGRPSEPTADNCASLRRLVAESDADLGVAHDGDADRMRAVAGDGTFLSGDVLLAILARSVAEPGESVAIPVDTSLAVADHLAADDVAVVRTRVGDVYVAERVTDPGVAFGGEPSGAWIFPDATLCPDGPLAAIRVAELAAERPLAERVADVDTYPIRRDSVHVDDKAAVVDRLADRVTTEYDDVTTLDGVRADLGDAWFLLRASGTESLIRVTAEARDAGRADEMFAEARRLLSSVLDT